MRLVFLLLSLLIAYSISPGDGISSTYNSLNTNSAVSTDACTSSASSTCADTSSHNMTATSEPARPVELSLQCYYAILFQTRSGRLFSVAPYKVYHPLFTKSLAKDLSVYLQGADVQTREMFFSLDSMSCTRQPLQAAPPAPWTPGTVSTASTGSHTAYREQAFFARAPTGVDGFEIQSNQMGFRSGRSVMKHTSRNAMRLADAAHNHHAVRASSRASASRNRRAAVMESSGDTDATSTPPRQEWVDSEYTACSSSVLDKDTNYTYNMTICVSNPTADFNSVEDTVGADVEITLSLRTPVAPAASMTSKRAAAASSATGSAAWIFGEVTEASGFQERIATYTRSSHDAMDECDVDCNDSVSRSNTRSRAGRPSALPASPATDETAAGLRRTRSYFTLSVDIYVSLHYDVFLLLSQRLSVAAISRSTIFPDMSLSTVIFIARNCLYLDTPTCDKSCDHAKNASCSLSQPHSMTGSHAPRKACQSDDSCANHDDATSSRGYGARVATEHGDTHGCHRISGKGLHKMDSSHAFFP